MNKLDSLRAALVAALPLYVNQPDRLVIFVDKGRLVSRLTASLAYEWRYVVRLEFHDFTGAPDDIAVPLLGWLRVYQPERLLDFAREDSALGFAADIIDAKTWDIVFSFELTEAVVVSTAPDGRPTIEHLPEPSLPDAMRITHGEIDLAGVDWQPGPIRPA